MQNRKEFRDYDHSNSTVKHTYELMHKNQNCFFVREMKKQYTSPAGYTTKDGKKIQKHLIEVFDDLDKIIDESDPDNQLPQIYHAYQTAKALYNFLDPENPTQLKLIPIQSLFNDIEWQELPENIKQKYSEANYIHVLYPEIKNWSAWLELTGFLHDIGKVMALEEYGGLPQWAVVGDTFPVGAPFSQSNVFAEEEFYKNNPDLNFPNQLDEEKKFGIYEKHCGFDNVDMSWGHDEYAYAVLKRTINCLPELAFSLIRYHSFYAWHTPRNGVRGYQELASELDWIRLPAGKLIREADLYSKKSELPDIHTLKSYYSDLINKLIPNTLDNETEISSPRPVLW